MTDKELIKLYLKKKGIRKHAFCVSVGFSKNFLASGSTINTANLRKIVNHSEYQDFNLSAFIQHNSDDIVKPIDELSAELINHSYLYQIMQEVSELKSKKYLPENEIDRLFELIEELAKAHSSLSEEYTKFYAFVKK